MISTVSEKGQITLPKALRDQLGIRGGSRLDLQVESDGRATLTVLSRGSDSLAGLLARPGEGARTLKEMDDGVSAAVTERSARRR